jgi:hypothetical protein
MNLPIHHGFPAWRRGNPELLRSESINASWMEKADHDERPIGMLRCAATTIKYSCIRR